MNAEGMGVVAGINDWLNQNIVEGVATGGILAAGGVLWAAFQGRRRIGWSIVYNEPVNQGHPDDRNMWEISWAGAQVDRGSLVILEIRNAGLVDIAAEDDALPFFPNVSVVPLEGQLPNRESALHHGYPFVATENLYTNPPQPALVTDYLDFLRSDAMTQRLHDNGYISCSEVDGTDLSGQCA